MIKKNFKDWTFYIYTALMLLISIYSYKKAAYNWDMLPYMTVVLQYDGNTDIEKIHSEVYTKVKQSVSETDFNKLVGSTSAYRKSVFTNTTEFNLQLPFYVVKPLYTRFCYLFYKCAKICDAFTCLLRFVVGRCGRQCPPSVIMPRGKKAKTKLLLVATSQKGKFV